MFLFRHSLAELPNQLSPMTRAVLLDLLAVGSVSVHGLIVAYSSDLFLHGIARTTVHRALNALEGLEIIARTAKGAIYVNPQVVYRGSGRNWSRAIDYWNCVKSQVQNEGGKDAK